MFNIRRPFKLLNLSIETPKCRSHSIKLSSTIQPSSKVSEEERLLFQNTQLQFQIHQKDEELKMYKIKQNQCQPKIGLNVDNVQQKQNVKKLQIYIKQLELELLQKRKCIEDLKKQMSLTKFQELQIETLAFQQECQRLIKQVQKLNKLLNYKNNGVDLFELYENLETQNKHLENVHKLQDSVIHELQDEQIKYKNQIEQLELENKNLNRENKKVLQLLNQNNTQKQSKIQIRNECMQEELEISKLKVKISYLQNQMIKQSNQKEKYIQHLLSIIMDKEDQIQAYEKQKIIIKEVSKPDQQILDLKYQQCIQQIKSEYSIYEDFSIDLPPQLNLTKQMSVRKKQNASEQQKSQFLELGSQIDEEQLSRNFDYDDSIGENEYRTKKLPKVNYYEVELIGRKLKFELQTKLIPLNYMDQIFDCTDEEYQDITVEEIIHILSTEPFLMMDEKERLLVARYLIEDNTQDYVLHNLMNSNSIKIIKSVFKQLLGKYQLFSKQEKSIIEQQLKGIFLRVQYKILDSLQQQYNLKNNNQKDKVCCLADFQAILKSCEIVLLPRQMEYLCFINFSICKQVEKLRYSELLDYFCNVQSL